MIPKIIHYCWFGKNPLPESANKCIESWKKYFPDYEIKEWNESNYDVHKIPYTCEAYEAKKYAFVSDYARFDILYEYGGIYFDVDVEVIKSFGKILDDTGFMGMETPGMIASGLGLGCDMKLKIVKEILEHYEKEHFLYNAETNDYNLETVVTRITDILEKNGFDTKNNSIQKIADFTIYPPEYFAPKNAVTGKLNITPNSVSIHHYDASWQAKNQILLKEKAHKFYKTFGVNTFSKFVISIMSVFDHILNDGFAETIKYYKKRFLKSR